MVHFDAEVAGVYVGFDPASLVTTEVPDVIVNWDGFLGDRHAGIRKKAGGREGMYPRGTEIRNYRQISAVSVEELAQISAALGIQSLDAGLLGANLLFRGYPSLTQLPPNTRLFFPNDTVLLVYGENLPCDGPGGAIHARFPFVVAADFPKAAINKRGIVGIVERIGVIRKGDRVRIHLPRSAARRSV